MTKKIDVLAYIRWYTEKLGEAPTQDEMAEALGVTKPAIRRHLRKLAAEGKLAYDAGVARSYRVL